MAFGGYRNRLSMEADDDSMDEPQRRKQDGWVRRKYQEGNITKELIGGFTLGVAVFCVIIYAVVDQPANMTKEQAQELFGKFWEWRMRASPEFCTLTGCHKYDDKLESYELQAFEHRKRACERFLHDAHELLSRSSVDETSKQNLMLFSSELHTFIKGIDAKGYLFPLNNLEGVHIEFERLVTNMKYENADDYRKLISRFKSLPNQISEIIELFREGIKLNMTYHMSSVNCIVKQLEELQATELQNSPYLKPLQNMPEAIHPADRSMLRDEMENALQVDVLTSFNRLKVFLETEYFKHLRPNESFSSLPNGEQLYQMCLDFHLGFTMSPEEVRNIGLEEVERIEKEMEKVIQKLELSVSPTEFAHKIKADKGFLFTSQEEMLETYKGIVFNTIQPKLPQIIKNIPSLKLSIVPSPPSMAAGPAAYYLAGTPDGSRPGTFYVNTVQVNDSPKYETVTLALHEAEPGHHLQLSYMMEMPDVPAFRQHVEDRKYSDVPSHFPMHTSYTEGWGLYSEYLGYELDMYDDPYLEYGHLVYEMFRACRLVVDTGLHFFGWTREQAIDYMVEHAAMHRQAIEKEVDRYITWPGQACAYKIGQIKIKELRKNAELALGSNFDVRDFHDVVLRSAGPLDLLEQNVNDYIKGKKG